MAQAPSKQKPVLGLGSGAPCADDSGINDTEEPMGEFDELAGRIDGTARALLTLAAHLEQAGVIDGPRLCADWRALQAPGHAPPPAARASLQVLRELAAHMDSARQQRRSRARR